MSVWDQIDKIKERHDAERKRGEEALEGYGGVKGSLRADEFGFWHCRYIPDGERRQESLVAKGVDSLIAQLKAVRAREEKAKQSPKRAGQ